MSRQRTDLGFGDALRDLSDFEPAPKSGSRDASTGKAARAAGFVSREAGAAEPSRTQRRRRTGRNAQFNIKARPETIAAFCEVADANGWGLGETLEHAVTLLKQHAVKD